jgi:hypothetical protein
MSAWKTVGSIAKKILTTPSRMSKYAQLNGKTKTVLRGFEKVGEFMAGSGKTMERMGRVPRGISQGVNQINRRMRSTKPINIGSKQAKKIITKEQARLRKTQATSNTLARRMSSKVGNFALGSTIALGAISSASLGLMNGMNNQARDYTHDRYIQDYTYSRSVLTNSRIGRSTGTRALDRYGSTLGLSNSLSATRHGR